MVATRNDNVKVMLVNDAGRDRVLACVMVLVINLVLALTIQFRINISKDFFVFYKPYTNKISRCV